MRRRHRFYAWARAHAYDSQEFVDSIHSAVNTAIDAAMNALFEAADHLDDVIDDLRERALRRERPASTPPKNDAWSDTD